MRLEQLTFTRFLAAIAIVIFHYGTQISPFNITKTLYVLFMNANIGVSYFFILSGFVMIIAYKKYAPINFKAYIQNRFARIYPLYFLAIVLSVIGLILKSSPINYWQVFLNVFVIQSWFPGHALSINTPGWSLSVEFFFYMLFPLLLNNIYSKWKPKHVVLLVVIIFVISQLVLHYFLKSSYYSVQNKMAHQFIYYWPLCHLNEFLVGNVTALWYLKYLKTWSVNTDIPILLLVFCMFFLLTINLGISYHNGFLAVIFVPLILLLSINKGYITKLFKLKPLVFLGNISYAIYILQYPIFNLTNRIARQEGIKDKTEIFYVFLVLLLIISAISYLYIEKPLRRLLKSK